MDTCDICGQGIDKGERQSSRGKTRCEPCRGGRYGFRLDHLGIKVWTKTWSERTQHGEPLFAEVRAMVPHAFEGNATFLKEGGMERFAKRVKGLFGKREVQVGDKAFDDEIYIKTSTPEQTREILQDGELRQAVAAAMDELRDIKEPDAAPALSLEGNAVVVQHQLGHSGHNVNTLRRPVVLTALSLLRKAQQAGLPRDDSLIQAPPFEPFTSRNPRTLSFVTTELQDLTPLERLVVSVGSQHLVKLRLTQCRLFNPDLSPLLPFKKTLTELIFTVVKSPRDLGPLASMTALERLAMLGSNVSDLSPIAGLEKLTELNVSESQVADLGPVAGLPKLEELHLRNTPVTDLSPLRGLSRLRLLNMGNTEVTDLTPLHDLSDLQEIRLGGSAVNEAQIQTLQSSLPSLVINREISQPNPPNLT